MQRVSREQRCRQKTAAGNCFRCKRMAKRMASAAQRTHGWPMHAYRCPFCPYYHVGSRQVKTLEEAIGLALLWIYRHFDEVKGVAA